MTDFVHQIQTVASSRMPLLFLSPLYYMAEESVGCLGPICI